MNHPKFTTYKHPLKLSGKEMIERAEKFTELIEERRSVRTFSSKAVPVDLIKCCIKAAGASPSGANMQPWYFVVVSDSELKKKIRDAAEAEEHEFYHGKAPAEWLDALAPLGTDESKPFLETAPYLIVIFEKKYEETSTGEVFKHYYTKESVGIATGILITALHNAGLSTLTHTPSPMNFLNAILNRPQNEKPFLILVAGYADEDTKVPDIKRKELEEIATFI
ncbi:MAG: nitroreductase family protein [Melioribacteraceae bacterium]|nr:nitroreductase family protein [Melioribacteraceae bacterium]